MICIFQSCKYHSVLIVNLIHNYYIYNLFVSRPYLQLFQHLLTESPEVMDRIVPIAGDITKPGLGLSKEDEEVLVKSVSIVFHLAATVRFNESLRDALQYNVIGVREMIKLCRKMKKLQVLHLFENITKQNQYLFFLHT